MNIRIISLFAALCAAQLSTAALSADSVAIAVVDPYVRLAPTGTRATAAYFTLQNRGEKNLRLISVSSPAARLVELHTHLQEDGMMKMRQVTDIAIPAGGKATLQPGGLHVMLIDLVATLKGGDSVPATLLFDDSSSLQVTMPVRTTKPDDAMTEVHRHH
jgi:copper(I)-binding protein